MVIRPECRQCFSDEDIDFLASVLGIHHEPRSVYELLHDPEALNIMLDEPVLFDIICNNPTITNEISQHLLFFILVRHSLRELEVEDRLLADYGASLLVNLIQHPYLQRPSFILQPLNFILQIIQELSTIDDENQRFIHRMAIANLTLFLIGVYPERIRARRAQDKTPHLSYLERLACHHLHYAIRSPVVVQFGLREMLSCCLRHFRRLRLAFNVIGDYEFFDRFTRHNHTTGWLSA
ncbi:MAG: hypothetical protein D6820_12840 [Lentisphaerae bacterium]|nr:MAG: hypothetical protein D6820_12840 [Lentisphaerota bacterium]